MTKKGMAFGLLMVSCLVLLMPLAQRLPALTVMTGPMEPGDWSLFFAGVANYVVMLLLPVGALVYYLTDKRYPATIAGAALFETWIRPYPDVSTLWFTLGLAVPFFVGLAVAWWPTSPAATLCESTADPA